MIQRIQTIYLLANAIFIGLILWMPLGYFIGGNLEFRLMAFGIQDAGNSGAGYIAPTIYMGILAVLCAAIPLVNIFLYKRRLLQIRLCFVEIVLLIGLQIFVVFYLFRSSSVVDVMQTSAVSYSIADLFPLAGMILSFMAFRAIARDEAMVRSLDRIR